MNTYHPAVPCDKCSNGFYEGPGYGLTVCVHCNGSGRIILERRNTTTPYQRWCFRWGTACLIIAGLVVLVWVVS